MTVHNHLEWVPTTEDGLGAVYALGTSWPQKRTDLPMSEEVDFETAVEMTALEFPPRIAVRRKIF